MHESADPNGTAECVATKHRRHIMTHYLSPRKRALSLSFVFPFSPAYSISRVTGIEPELCKSHLQRCAQLPLRLDWASDCSAASSAPYSREFLSLFFFLVAQTALICNKLHYSRSLVGVLMDGLLLGFFRFQTSSTSKCQLSHRVANKCVMSLVTPCILQIHHGAWAQDGVPMCEKIRKSVTATICCGQVRHLFSPCAAGPCRHVFGSFLL